jgi:beta-lactamase regulating signal transducer with metallopeptidase domain
MNDAIEILGNALILFILHATLLLTLVWAIERLGWLKHPGWAEFAWRAALFGAFFSVAFEFLPMRDTDTSGLPASPRAATAETVFREDTSRGDPKNMNAASANVASTNATAGNAAASAPVASARIASRVGTTADAATQTAAMPAPVKPAVWEIDASWLSIALFAWTFGVVLLSLWTLRQLLALRRLKRRVRRDRLPASEAMHADVAQLSAQMALRAPAVHVLPDLASPLVMSNTVLLPRWAEGLDRTQRVAMLAHELAHLRRRDPLWRPLQRIALIPLFFHPLAWRAVRRLEALAETLCDRAAVERSGSARALAECLAECLARQSEQRSPMWAVAMAEHSDGIVARVRHLLEASPMKLSSIPKRWRWGAAVAALCALIALPGVLIVARDSDASLSITYRQGGSTYRTLSTMPTPGERLRIEVDGDVEFNARESDVVRLGPNAYVEIEETRGAVTRMIRIVGKDGRIVHQYSVGQTVRPFDDDGRAWLAQKIPDIFRMTGFDAERRAKRILSQGGPARLIAEIDAINGDYARAEYLGQLFAQAQLDEPQFAKAMTQVEVIESDFEKRRALEIALERDLFTPAYQTRLLTIAAGFESDFERAEWLSQAIPRFEIGEAERVEWTTMLNTFDSDFERRRTLERVIEAGRPQATAIAIALQSARAMDSDFERRSLLEKAAGSGIGIADNDYLQVVDAMGSDFEQREALLALIKSGMPSRERSDAILRSARGIESEFERSQVLDALAAKMPDDAELIRSYRGLIRGMSNEARGSAERALDRFENG